MGRIKTTLVKRISHDLHEQHGKSFTTSFEENKRAVEEFAELPSKKIRNTIAGYLTRLKKKEAADAL